MNDATALLLSWVGPEATDLSRDVLTTVFGTQWWDLRSAQGSAFFTILVVLNAICAVLIAGSMLMRLVAATVGVAWEGRFRRQSAWVPLRFAFAMAAVTPVLNGMCALHLLLLSCIGVSVSMANSMVETVLSVLASKSTLTPYTGGGSSYSVLGNTLDTGEGLNGGGRSAGKALAVQILHNEAFLTYLHTQLGCDVPVGNFAEHMVTEIDAETGNALLYFNGSGRTECERGYMLKNKEAYGGFVLEKDLATLPVPIPIEERARLLKDLVRAVEATGAPAHFASFTMAGHEVPQVIQDRAQVQAAGVAYAAELSRLVSGKGTRSEELQDRLNALIAESKTLGWFALGSQYWTFLTLEQELVARDAVPVAWIAPDYRAFADVLPASFLTGFWPRINEASYLGDTPARSVSAKILEYIQPFTALPKRWANALQESPDALLAMVTTARWVSGTCTSILIAAEAAKLTALAGTKLVTRNIFGRIGDLLTGSGDAVDTTVQALVHDVSFFLHLVLLPVWCCSTFVAYAVPAIPFLTWIAAIATWVAMTIEAVVAAPLWLLGHAMPEGEGFAGAHGRAGYLLLLQVLLRPSLLVIGLFACLLAMRATGQIIGALAAPFIAGEANASYTLGITGCLMVFFLQTSAISILTWKLFALVRHLPDTVLRWIGTTLPQSNLTLDAEIHRTQSAFATAAQAQAQTASHTLPKTKHP